MTDETSDSMASLDTPIILLHGLGEHAISLWPLEKYLNYLGYSNTHRLTYPVDSYDTLGPSLDHVDGQLAERISRETPIVVIGQSMGGVVANNLHRKGWTLLRGIYIGSPLHGARLLKQLEEKLATKIRDAMYKPPYDFLKEKGEEPEPPHDYRTVSMGWFWSDFDGCVYRDEATLDPEKHTHLKFGDHRTIFVNPRLWVTVAQLMP